MLMRMLVQKVIFKPQSPKRTDGGKEIPGEFWPESWSLFGLDASNPPEHRMEEAFFYKLTPAERDVYVSTAVDKVLTVSVKKFAHYDSGQATLLGQIVPDTTPGKPGTAAPGAAGK